MKKILIIGGSYFLGRVFVETLLQGGDYEITVLNRGRIPIRKAGVSEIVCDRHDGEALKIKIPRSRWDGVVDFCAYTPEDIPPLMDALRGSDVGQYLLISTASVYAPTAELPIQERSPLLDAPLDDGPGGDYGYQKARTEEAVVQSTGFVDLRYTILRPAFIYGKYNYAPRESYFFDRYLKEEPLVVPSGCPSLFSFVSVWDAARMIEGCIGREEALDGKFNLAGPELLSYPRLLEVFRDVTGKNPPVQRLSPREIVEQRIPLPFPLEEHLVYDGTAIAAMLDRRYTPFAEGMADTYRFYRIGKGLD